MPFPSPRLWVVAGTLGNPGDFSPRARQALQGADLILAEDTRRAGLFFQRHEVVPRGSLRSFFEHNEQERIPFVLKVLEQGRDVALISDAGTPLIGDPGYRLVRACREAGFSVSPVPGPCAPVAALCASGLPPSPFTFLGFLPRQAGDKKRLFRPCIQWGQYADSNKDQIKWPGQSVQMMIDRGGIGHVEPVIAARQTGHGNTPPFQFLRNCRAYTARGADDQSIIHADQSRTSAVCDQPLPALCAN